MNLSNQSLFRQQAFINGKWVSSADDKQLPVYNPSTNELLGHVPMLTAEQVDNAISCANSAWVSWREKAAKERSAILRSWFELIIENQEDLATIMTLEQGKPLNEAKVSCSRNCYVIC